MPYSISLFVTRAGVSFYYSNYSYSFVGSTRFLMTLEFTWINLLILFGAFQGLIFGIILLFNKKHPGAKFLSVVMFTLAYNGIETFNWSAGLERSF